MKIEQSVDNRGFNIKFNKGVRLPKNCTDWTSENEGVEMLRTDFLPSEETLTFMYDQDIDVKVRWKVASANEIEPATGRLLQDSS